MIIDINRNNPIPKLACLYDREFVDQYEYFLLHGGRGGGKTEELASKSIITTFEDPHHWLCTREIQNSIEDSVKATIEEWIDKMGVRRYFASTKTEIVNRVTGAKYLFKGMKAGTERDTIKSLKGVKYVWYEEAQGMTEESWEKLNPTIRIDGRKLFFSFNPEEADAPIEKIREFGDKVCAIEINYMDNPYLPQVLLDQAMLMKELYPELYKHVWLGQHKTTNEAMTVLPYDMLRKCIDAHKTLGNYEGHTYGALDLAPGEDERKHDKNAECFVKGPVVLFADHWQCDDLDLIADKTIMDCKKWGAIRLYFDAVGVGGFANGTFRRKLRQATDLVLKCEPFMGSQGVFGAESTYMEASTSKKGVITNKDFFENAGSQSWWNLRLRMENTIRMLRGETVRDPSYYLSFDSSNPNLERLMIELSQATYKEGASGRILIDKAPGDKVIKMDGKSKKVRSPNLADSCRMAFLRSCMYGLRDY